MARRSDIVVGLDVGSSRTSVVVGERSETGSVQVLGLGSAPSRGLRKGTVINMEATVASIQRALAHAESSAGCEVSNVVASISGTHIKSLNSHGVVAVKSREVGATDIDKVLEAARAVAIPVDREIIHVIPQEYSIDGQGGIREPLGMAGVRLEANVHVISGSVASAQNIVKCANRCGLTVQDIVFSPLAAARAVLTEEERELGVCLIDIGGGTCDIAVFREGAVVWSGVLAIGGAHITHDVAAGLRTPLFAAESIKSSYGSALVDLVNRDETIEVPSTGGRAARILSKVVLAEIIEPRVTEMFTLIQQELMKAGCIEGLTSGVVLVGGSARLSGIVQVAEHVLNLPVRLGEPAGLTGLDQLVRGPEYATAAGLLLYSAESDARWKVHHGSRGVVARMSGWLREHL